ncbi:MAG: hypothetical protein WBB65_03900 [Anaerolineales bacterium]
MDRAFLRPAFAGHQHDRRAPHGWRGHLRSNRQLAFNHGLPESMVQIREIISGKRTQTGELESVDCTMAAVTAGA